MNNYGWSLHNQIRNTFAVTGLWNKTWNLNLLKPTLINCTAQLNPSRVVSTHMNTLFIPKPLLLQSLKTTETSQNDTRQSHTTLYTFLPAVSHYSAHSEGLCSSLNREHLLFLFHTTSSDSRLYSSYNASRMASCFSMAGRYTPRSLCMPLIKSLFSLSPSLDTKAAVKL